MASFRFPCSIILSLVLSALLTPVHGQSGSAADTLTPISGADLQAAVEAGEAITGRIVNGEDLATVLDGFLKTDDSCASHHGLQLRNSRIRGNFALKSELLSETKSRPKPKSTQAPADDDDASDDGADESGATPARWLSIPLSMTDSTVEQFSAEAVGLSCPVDLSGSTFENAVALRTTTFAADLAAERTVFKGGITALGSHFRADLLLRRAKFVGNAEFNRAGRNPSLFDGAVDCREAVFSRLASFIGSRFLGHMDFRYVQFANDVNFGNAELGTGPPKSFNGAFYMAEFGGAANFRNARFKGLRFWRTLFRNGADFYRAHGQTLQLWDLSVHGPLAFDDAHVDTVELNGFGGAMVVEGDTSFRRASIDRLTLMRVTFKRPLDMEEASVGSRLRMRRIAFEDDFRLLDSALPGQVEKDGADDRGNEIAISDITLNKGLFMDADQFLERSPWWAFWRKDKARLYANDLGDDPNDVSAKDNRRVWRELMRAFEIAKNVELKNYAEYQLRVLEEVSASGLQRLANTASRWFWGYGLRPLRTLFWLAVVILGFAGIYWTQLSAAAASGPPVSRLVRRARLALEFSGRTAWQFKFGYDNSTTPAFRAITMLESLMAKAILPCFVYALTQTSPLLSELMKKLLP